MTPVDIFKTAFAYIPETEKDSQSFGYGLKHGINQVCICCKSTDTTQLQGNNSIPWQNFYQKHAWAAYECNVCGYKFSWYKEKGVIHASTRN